GVVIARPFIAQGAVNDDEIRRVSSRDYLAGRGQTDERAASASEKLFRDQYRKRRANYAAKNANRLSAKGEGVEIGMIAGPSVEALCVPGSFEASQDVAVRIEDTDWRHIDDRQAFLAAGFAQKRCGCKN